MKTIIDVNEEVNGIYGYRRMTIYLNHYCEEKANHKCVYRVLTHLGIKSVIRKKRYHYKPHKPQNVAETFKQIVGQLLPNKTLIHSDRGYQYTSHWLKEYIKRNEVIQSMSRPGYCIDNGPMESFWGILKDECYRRRHFEDLESAINTYINFYNSKRVTLSMGLRIPL